MANFEYEILEHFGVISETSNGWTKELNLVSWNKHKPEYEIRTWEHENSKAGKGITLTHEELITLKELLDGMDLENLEENYDEDYEDIDY